MSNLEIGFVGLGSMGKPMVKCLLRAGYKLSVYDTNKAAIQELGDEVKVVNTPAELAKKTQVIITMLPNSAIVNEVLNSDEGLYRAIQADSVIIEMSSGDPVLTKKFAEEAVAHQAHLVDAPVSGGVTRAESGELSIMYGGSEEILSKVKPILLAMGSSVSHTGEVGSAHAMKALNNLVSAGGFLIGIEAILLGKRFGLNPEVMVDILNSSTGMNNSTQKKFKQFVISEKYNSGFGLDLMVKDLGIALNLDEEGKAQFSQLCLQICQGASQSLGKGSDPTELAKYISQYNGVSLP